MNVNSLKKELRRIGKASPATNPATEDLPFLAALRLLDPSDQSLIRDAFFYGKPYWLISMETGYSPDGVRKRIDRVLKNLASLLEG